MAIDNPTAIMFQAMATAYTATVIKNVTTTMVEAIATMCIVMTIMRTAAAILSIPVTIGIAHIVTISQ